MSGTMRAVYDLARCPPTYDIVAFLSLVELARVNAGRDDIELHFLPGSRDGFRADTLWPRSVEERNEMLEAVAVPLCYLLPSLRAVSIHTRRKSELVDAYGHNQYLISLPNIVKGLKAGSRPLRALGNPKPDPKLVTITLREAEHWPLRNSVTEYWVEAAQRMEKLGFHVVVIRDTRLADIPIVGVETSPNASKHILARAALYGTATLNMGVSNGPMWMAIMMDAPVAMLRPTTERAGGCFTNGFFRQYGVNPGHNLPNAPPHQRLFWTDDSVESIMSAFDSVMSHVA